MARGMLENIVQKVSAALPTRDKNLAPHTKIASTLLLAIALSGCVNYASTVKRTEALDPTVGYVYGRFNLTPASSLNARIGLVVQEDQTKETYTLLFHRARSSPVSITAIKPGLYTLAKFSFAKKDLFIMGTELRDSVITDQRLATPFRVEPGKAYYIGDFVGQSTQEFNYFSWKINSIHNNYRRSTEELKEKFPNLNEIETIPVIGGD